jgi:hypothetical protein
MRSRTRLRSVAAATTIQQSDQEHEAAYDAYDGRHLHWTLANISSRPPSHLILAGRRPNDAFSVSPAYESLDADALTHRQSAVSWATFAFGSGDKRTDLIAVDTHKL